MIKSVTVLLCSLMLVSAIVVPAVVSLVEQGHETVLAWDFGEEENQNEGKETWGEKDFYPVQWPVYTVAEQASGLPTLISLTKVDGVHFQEIPSPPPEV